MWEPLPGWNNRGVNQRFVPRASKREISDRQNREINRERSAAALSRAVRLLADGERGYRDIFIDGVYIGQEPV